MDSVNRKNVTCLTALEVHNAAAMSRALKVVVRTVDGKL